MREIISNTSNLSHGTPQPEFPDRRKRLCANANIQYDENAETISVFRGETLLLVQNVKSDIRPYIHPIIAPDGIGVLTEFSPSHHKHQTGLYWGLKKVNGRDYFMNWKGDYWRKVSASVIADQDPR